MSEFNDFFVKFPKGMEGDEQYAIEVVNIQGLFKGESKYTIPPYQRPYSWTKKEVKELITDLDKTLKEQKKWFCGPIFTTQESFKDFLINQLVITYVSYQKLKITTQTL